MHRDEPDPPPTPRESLLRITTHRVERRGESPGGASEGSGVQQTDAVLSLPGLGQPSVRQLFRLQQTAQSIFGGDVSHVRVERDGVTVAAATSDSRGIWDYRWPGRESCPGL